ALGGNRAHARPGRALPADANAIADCLAITHDEVEAPLARLDNDRSCSVLAGVVDDFPGNTPVDDPERRHDSPGFTRTVVRAGGVRCGGPGLRRHENNETYRDDG